MSCNDTLDSGKARPQRYGLRTALLLFRTETPRAQVPSGGVHKYHRKRLPNIIYSLTKTTSHRSPPLPQCEQKQTTSYKTNGNETLWGRRDHNTHRVVRQRKPNSVQILTIKPVTVTCLFKSV